METFTRNLTLLLLLLFKSEFLRLLTALRKLSVILRIKLRIPLNIIIEKLYFPRSWFIKIRIEKDKV